MDENDRKILDQKDLDNDIRREKLLAKLKSSKGKKNLNSEDLKEMKELGIKIDYEKLKNE